MFVTRHIKYLLNDESHKGVVTRSRRVNDDDDDDLMVVHPPPLALDGFYNNNKTKSPRV